MARKPSLKWRKEPDEPGINPGFELRLGGEELAYVGLWPHGWYYFANVDGEKNEGYAYATASDAKAAAKKWVQEKLKK